MHETHDIRFTENRRLARCCMCMIWRITTTRPRLQKPLTWVRGGHGHVCTTRARVEHVHAVLRTAAALVEDAGLAAGRSQRAAIAGRRGRAQELGPAAPREEAAAVGALALESAAGHQAAAAAGVAPPLNELQR